MLPANEQDISREQGSKLQGAGSTGSGNKGKESADLIKRGQISTAPLLANFPVPCSVTSTEWLGYKGL